MYVFFSEQIFIMASNAVEVEVKEENLIKDEVSSDITDKDENNQLTKASV